MWNDLLRSGSIYFEKEGLGDSQCVAKWEAVFDDGRTAALKVCTSERNAHAWAEAVLYDEGGRRLSQTAAPPDELDGPEWLLYYGDDEYHVQVFGE